jgi:hypothetical protein
VSVKLWHVGWSIRAANRRALTLIDSFAFKVKGFAFNAYSSALNDFSLDQHSSIPAHWAF